MSAALCHRPRSRRITLLLIGVVILISLLLLPFTARATDWYASPSGSSTNSGTSTNSPWDIFTAFTATGSVQAGDTLWLMDGTYTGGWNTNLLDQLNLTLNGASNAPVKVKSLSGNLLSLSCDTNNSHDILTVQGQWLEVWNVNISDPSTDRWGTNNSHYADGLTVAGPFNKFINGAVHDTGEGVYIQLSATNTEFYGFWIFNNGCENLGVDNRGHGHGFYVKSAIPKTLLSDNIIFNQEDNGIQCFTEDNSVPLNGIDLEGNIIFGNGRTQWGGESAYGIEVGGYGNRGVDNLTVCSNISLGGNDNFDAGYRAAGAYGCVGGNACSTNYVNGTATITFNHFLGSWVGAYYWSNLTLKACFIGGTTGTNDNYQANVFGPWFIFPQPNVDSFTLPAGCIYNVDSNQFYMSHAVYPDTFMVGTSHVWMALGDYTAATGFDVHSTISTAPPTNVEIYVRINKYDPSRANLVVINWPTNNVVMVDLAGFATNGDTITVLNGQNPLSNALLIATYTGPFSLPMTNLTVAIPTGTNQAPSSVGPFFGVFPIQKTAGASSAPATLPAWAQSALSNGYRVVSCP